MQVLSGIVVYGSIEMYIIMNNLEMAENGKTTEILEIDFFLIISSDSCHKKILLESMNIPINLPWKEPAMLADNVGCVDL